MLKFFSLLPLTVALLAMTQTSNAQMIRNDDAKYYSIEKVIITDMDTQETATFNFQAQPMNDSSLVEPIKEIGNSLTEMINIGKNIWDLVKANRPVVNVSTDFATVLPFGIQAAQELQGWSMPNAKTYSVSYVNGYGSNVIDFSFRLLYTHGGNLNGLGKYLSNVTMIPANLSVSWGFTFAATTKVLNIINTGTKEDPVAGVEMLLDWSVDTIFKHERQTFSVFVQGDGAAKVLE